MPIALVTGAAGDIGRAVAARLADDGWRLALTDHPRAGERLADLSAALETGGANVWTGICDVTDAAAVRSLVGDCCRHVGAPNGLFNNAGMQGSFGPVPNIDLADARLILEVNVVGVLTVLQEVAAAMIRAKRRGAVVNAASMAGVSGAPNMAAYSASKAAVIGLTKSAAKDLAPAGIRVNSVSPAFIGPGAMWDAQVAAQANVGSQYFSREPAVVARQMIDMVPMRRYGSPQEVASVVAFLLSDQSSYITGHNIEISGGSA
jgi:2-dehydro-3-deoxy-L-rhamnonate dehydrogenase (NAD+)